MTTQHFTPSSQAPTKRNRTSIYARLDTPLMRDRLAAVSRGDPDCEAHVRVALIERALQSPSFARQRDGYLITKAKWIAADYRKAEQRYDRYVLEEPTLRDEEIGDDVSAFDEMIPDGLPTPEQEVEWRETVEGVRAIVKTLTRQQRQVAELLMFGYKSGEVSQILNLSRSSVSHITRRMQQAMAAAPTMSQRKGTSP